MCTKVRSMWPAAQQRRPAAKLRGQRGQGKQTQLGFPALFTHMHVVVLTATQWVGGSENWQGDVLSRAGPGAPVWFSSQSPWAHECPQSWGGALPAPERLTETVCPSCGSCNLPACAETEGVGIGGLDSLNSDLYMPPFVGTENRSGWWGLRVGESGADAKTHGDLPVM